MSRWACQDQNWDSYSAKTLADEYQGENPSATSPPKFMKENFFFFYKYNTIDQKEMGSRHVTVV